MTTEQIWHHALQKVSDEYKTVPEEIKSRLHLLATETKTLKERHQEIVSRSSIQSLCAECMGECCKFGKNHFSVVDALIHISSEQPLPEYLAASPVCPFHHGKGCVMSAPFRPLNCIIFICELVEKSLPTDMLTELLPIETRLREIFQEFEVILGNRFLNGLLITCARAGQENLPVLNFQKGRRSNGDN